MNKKILYLTEAAVIAAIYTVLVFLFQYSSFGPFQFRIAEALTILPYFSAAAIPGVTLGCLLSNILFSNIFDIIFGTLATLIGAYLSYRLRANKFLVPIPPIVVNALIIPWVLKYAGFAEESIPLMMVSIAGGQLLAAGVLGMLLLFTLDKVKHIIFKNY
ncbi:QueT transporter family protein [Herbinix luporum]|jgi:uncharacterized membrane protein|uniref:Putative membrane protein n=1 Tax=Herbinix luporum TaxID=1679721 RepID=A0A0K8J870_9FIRM|nr:QueT transporter family protein [Herbinix luporum]MDI9489656.1 QueT transporter family protein [Bacillota bacterium]CUH93826.1 putative membrane protein [Herbinix luporum]HHT57601.1 QueT transporter family protein [Herbinix luporum]